MDIIKKSRLQAPNSNGMRRVRWAVVRNTYGELRDTTIKTVLDWLPEVYFGAYHKTDHTYKITGIKDLEAELLFRALDTEEDVKKLLSLELTGAWVNEFRQVPKAILDALQGRVGRFPSAKDEGCTWSGVIGDSNPYEEDSEYAKYLESDNRPDNVELYRQPSGLSPEAENIPFLPKGYYENLAKGKDREFVKVFVHGENGFIQDGDPITPEYSEALHRSPDVLIPYPGVRGIRFWDAGHNPTCIIAQIHPVSGRLIVYDTLVGVNVGMKQLIAGEVKPLMNSKYAKVTTWIDTGDPAVTTRDDADIELSPARVIEVELKTTYTPGVKEWETRKEAIKSVLTGAPLLLLSHDEERLHKAFRGGWQYTKVTSGQKVSNIAMKNIHSHPADAISQGLPRIISVAPAKPQTPKKPKPKKHWLMG